MSSLADYIRWYSVFSFDEMPFNDVDNLVLCMLSYYNYDLKKTSGNPCSLRRCVTNEHGKDAFLSAAYHSRRFGSLMVSEVCENFSRDAGTQFAAMTVRLYDNVYYIVFRGTDNSLVGWKEDFIMSYRITEGQNSAVEYLDRVIADDKVYFVGGHSKGGNLAMYGACHISEEKRSRIKRIYNNDGPGLCPEVSDVTLFDKIRDRTTVILPQYCIFGKIFAHPYKEIKIVSSSYEGINQHDIISWCVDHGRLDKVDDFDPASEWFNEVAEKWLHDISPAERESFVNTVFSSVEARGAQTYTEAMKLDIDGVEDLIVNVVESDNLRTVAKLPEKMFFGELVERLKTGKLSRFINANQLIEGISFVAAGILMAIFTDSSVQVIITSLLGAVMIFQLVYTIKKLHDIHWNFYRARTLVYIFLVIATLFVVIVAKNRSFYIIGSGIAGGWLLIEAYRSFLAVRQRKQKDFLFWKNLIKCIVYTVCGLLIVFVPPELLQWFMLILGGLMVIDGVSSIIHSVIEANEKYSAKYRSLKDKVRKKKR